MIELCFLGTGGFHPTESRHTACYFLRQAGLILDAGTGMFRIRELLCTDRLDILLSHAHLDHCQGLTYLLDLLWEKEVRSVRIHGRPADLDAVKRSLFDSPLFPVACAYELRSLAGELTLGDWRIDWRDQNHPGGSLGYRLSNGEVTFAYVTDTTCDPADAAAVDFVRDVDLLLHECYFDDEHAELAGRTGHSYATAVGKLAKTANVRKLELIHVNPIATPEQIESMRRRVAHFAPSAEIACDGAVLKLQGGRGQ